MIKNKCLLCKKNNMSNYVLCKKHYREVKTHIKYWENHPTNSEVKKYWKDQNDKN